MTTHLSAAPNVLEAIVAQMPDALIFADCHGVIRLWNGGATHKDGRRLFVELSFGIVTDDRDQVLGAIAVGRDCSDRYELEKSLKERLARLEAGSA